MKKNGCAADGSERFSPLDALAITNYGQGTFAAITSPGKAVAGGYPFEVLEKVSRKGAIFKESCAPFDAAVTAGSKKAGVELQPPWLALRWIYDEYQKTRQLMVSCPIQPFADLAKQLANLQTSSEEIQRALSWREFTFFLKDAVIPKKCENERVKLPPYKANTLKNMDINVVSAKMDELLNEKRPFSMSLCHSNSMEKICGPHAVVIGGKRNICCGNSCREQWKVVDSAGAFTGKEIDKDGWVDRKEVINRTEGLLRYGINNKVQVDALNWISEK